MKLEHETLVKEIILLKASNSEQFTAHDVTRAVRHQVGPHVDIPHHEVKLIVHNLFESGLVGTDYTRTLVPFPGASPVPFVYHRTVDDPANYKRPDDSTLPPSPLVGNSITAVTPFEDICHVDARETLCVPARHIRAIGMNVGDVAYVWGDFDNNCAVLGTTVPDTEYFEYTVDRGHNVRITQHGLAKCGQAGMEYKIVHSGNIVRITRP